MQVNDEHRHNKNSLAEVEGDPNAFVVRPILMDPLPSKISDSSSTEDPLCEYVEIKEGVSNDILN